MNSSIGPIDGILTSTTTPGLSEPENNGNEGLLYIPQRSKTGASPSDAGECKSSLTFKSGKCKSSLTLKSVKCKSTERRGGVDDMPL